MLKCLLAPAALLYKAGVTFRHRLFDWGVLKSEKFDIPVVCIGNITVGGTGKTPMAEMVIAYMSQMHNVALLSRGYGRRTKGYREVKTDSHYRDVGDEPLQIKLKFPGTVVVVCEKRAECIRRAILDGKDARVILLTGKGEETTMKRGSVFDPYPRDIELTLKYLAEYDKAHPAAPASSGKKAKKDFLPIILGSDENAYGTARLFQEAYHVTPLLLCTQQLVPTSSSHLFLCRIIPDFEREEVFPDALLGVLKQCAQDYEKLLVIPCSDYYTGLLCRHYDHFEGLIANRFISDELLETFDTKDKFYALCEQYGMDYPKTVVASPEERESVVDRLPFDFPIVVKPENSNALDYLRCHFEGQKKVFFFDTREQYLTMVHSMNQSDYRGKLILQEFIPGGDDAMRVLNSYSDLDGQVRAMCLVQPVLENYDPKSVGNYAAILSRGGQAM